MASDNEASCESDPNFAVICAFMEKFGTTCGLQSVDFLELQEMLENTQEVRQELIDLHIKLLRKSRKTVSNERWEKAIIKFCHTFCVQDAWEIERFGYKKARLSSKLRVLKELLEMQFDFNARFKAEINKMSAEELRSQPLGKDKHGHAYWFQNDNNCQIRVYKEDPDEETWTLVAKDRNGLAALIGELSDGDSKISSDAAINEEDSNSLAEKPIIDTGQVDSSSDSTKKSSVDSENSNESLKKEENISPQETDDDKEPDAKKPKLEVSEAIEEPLMLVKGEGAGEDNNGVNPIVGEEIEEDLMFVYGVGSGAECGTGNEDGKPSDSQSEAADTTRESNSVSISDSKNCANDEVPTSPVKSPYKLGTIIDTKTDNKFFSAAKSPARKSRWDVETIIGKSDEEESPKKTMFFFGPGCLQFSPAAMAFGQKVPLDRVDKAKGDVGYRIGDVNETPVDSRIVDNLEQTKVQEALEEQIRAQGKAEPDGGHLPEVTAALLGCKLPETVAPENEEVCVKKHIGLLLENHDRDENENDRQKTANKVEYNRQSEVAENEQSCSTKPEDVNVPNTETRLPNFEEGHKCNEIASKSDQKDEADQKPESEETSIVEKHDQKSEKPTTSCVDNDQKLEDKQDSEENQVTAEALSTERDEKLEAKQDLEEQQVATKVLSAEHVEKSNDDQDQENQVTAEGLNTECEEKLKDKRDLEENQVVTETLITESTEKSEKIRDEEENQVTAVVLGNKSDDSLVMKKSDAEDQSDDRQDAEKGEPKSEDVSNVSCDVGAELDTSKPNEEAAITMETCMKAEEKEQKQDEDNVEDEQPDGSETKAESLAPDVEVVHKDVKTPEQGGKRNVKTVQKSESNFGEQEVDHKNLKTSLICEKRSEETVQKSESSLGVLEVNLDVDQKPAGTISSDESAKVKTDHQTEQQDSPEQDIIKTSVERKVDQDLESDESRSAENDYLSDGDDHNEAEAEPAEEEDEIVPESTKAKAIASEHEQTENRTKLEGLGDSPEPKTESKNSNATSKEPVVYLKLEDKLKAEEKSPLKEEEKTVSAPARRGRKKNSSDQSSVEEDKKPRVATRRTRSAKSADGVEEQFVEVPPRTRRPRQRASPKVIKEETAEDVKKIKLSEKSVEVSETVIVESSSSNDVVEVPDNDPLTVSDEDAKDKPLSLASFSMDFNEAAAPSTKRTLRKRGRESSHNSEEAEETSGKRPKMKAKRSVDVKLRKSIEAQKKKDLISSDDDSKAEVESKEKSPEKEEETVLVSSDAESEKKKKKKGVKNKNKRLLSHLGIDPSQLLTFGQDEVPMVRQSRRIAQLKIKEEAERRKLEDELVQETHKKKKSKKNEDKDYKTEKKKPKEGDDDEGEDDSSDSKKRKRRKKKKRHRKFDELNPWRSSSDSSSSNGEEEMGEEEEEEDEEVLQYVSDHEFSPESDMEGDGEALPLKRARTARKESDVEEEVDDCPCQKCGKSDHPEWILLCDSCDNGWHCSCLRPPLLVIPEGDWFCPPCQHITLLEKLQVKLQEYDKKLNKKEIEDRRKQRLAYVGISLNSVLPAKDTENIKKKRRSSPKTDDEADVEGEDASSEESESGSGSATPSESGSDSDEPIYQLRQRRQAHSYRFNDYDDLINSAIQDEMEAVKGAGNQGRGKDIATIVNAEKEEERKKDDEETTEVELEPLPPVVPVNEKDKEARPLFGEDDILKGKRKIIGRKKHRKLNALDISSADEDGDSDEDFKGTSSESEDDFDDDLGSDDSELDTVRRKKGSDPVRRSTRARTSRYDADFIDDGDSDSDDDAPRRKKKRSTWEESESEEESDRSWGRRRRKPASRSRRPTATNTSKKKKSKKKKKRQDSDEEVYKKKKPKIKFGLDEEDDGPVRRTRGKKINYVDALGSDSDDDRIKRPPPKIDTDEEYVNEDEESGEESKAPKIHIQSYTDARFTQVLPEPRNNDDGDELNPIDQINRNVEMMDENEMEKMMEEEEYANKQLQMVALQLEKEKRRKEREAKKLEQLARKPRKNDHFQFSGPVQEPLVGNVDSLIVNAENNDELSEPPGVSLPLFSELGTGGESLEDPVKKRRGKPKKSLEEAVANLGGARHHEGAPPFLPMGNKLHPADLPVETNLEIAAPPQPFAQSQPTPSVITRMLQNKPGQPGYPVGTIRPKQFATMSERDDDPHQAMTASPGHPGQYVQGGRPAYRQLPPSLNNYPRNAPPPQSRQIYHSHRPMDPSPSGGGPISIAEHGSPGRVVSPAASSPGSNKNGTPPPPYSRVNPPAPAGRFPPRQLQMVPPPHLQQRPNLSPYHPGMPPQYQYPAQYGPEDALPPTMYQNSPYSEPFEGQVNASENSNSKSFEEESGGEFGGLVSYFSSQREDDLES